MQSLAHIPYDTIRSVMVGHVLELITPMIAIDNA